MQALRLARSAALLPTGAGAGTGAAIRRRCLATATANHVEVTSSTIQSASLRSSGSGAPVGLANIEAQWEKLSSEERLTVHEQLEGLQVKDWKDLSVDEKKAAYFVGFGPHGPRTPTSQPGDGLKIVLSTVALVGVSGLLFFAIKSMSPAPPKSMSKEWQEATNERALEMKINPITGISSEGYSGKGFVQSK